MAGVENPHQYQMFTGELVDNRTRSQKQTDQQRANPQQARMFSQRDMAQFGVNARPLFSLSPRMLLPMMLEDPRTEEEIERDRMKEAQRLTVPLFPHHEDATTPQTAMAAGTPMTPFPMLQPTNLPERRKPTPPAPPGQFAVQQRFAPTPADTPKRERGMWRPPTTPAGRREQEQAAADDPDLKNDAFCHLAVTTKAFALRSTGDALATTSLLFTLLLATIEAQSVGLSEGDMRTAHRIGQAAAERHTARKDV
ncbi:MAG: hypothetical protein KJ064_17780 [Anaerolineae bacterium]|nr:hypothetical protein [Anaerolineae bacterium]